MGRADPKSRHGCVQCKRRKVKCNEVLPVCGNCARRRETCSYLHASRSPPSNHTSPGSHAGVPERSPRALLELELTYFFLQETLPSILFSASRQDLWRRVIFPQGFSHPEVLDCHLATAALHKYTLTKSTDQASEYLQFASEKQASVLSTFMPMLSNPCAETARSLFAVSALVTFWAFASGSFPPQLNTAFTVTTRDPSAPDPVADLISVIKVSRGISAVIHQCRTWLHEQGLAEMIKSPEVAMRTCPEPCEALDRLLCELREGSRLRDGGGFSETQLEVYAAGVARTKYFLQRVAGDVGKEIALGWGVGLPQAFVDALSRFEHAALVILAFWAASLHSNQGGQWWADGWGRNVVVRIVEILGDEWRHHLDWPLMTVSTPEQPSPDLVVDQMLV